MQLIVWKVWTLAAHKYDQLNRSDAYAIGLIEIIKFFLIIYMEMINWSITALFWISANSVSTILGALNEQIQEQNNKTDDLVGLVVWKAQHETSCKLVSLMSSNFGPYLLVVVCYGFISFITNTYHASMFFLYNTITFQTLGNVLQKRFLYEFFVLFCVIYACHDIEEEVWISFLN